MARREGRYRGTVPGTCILVYEILGISDFQVSTFEQQTPPVTVTETVTASTLVDFAIPQHQNGFGGRYQWRRSLFEPIVSG